jgi:hypothetical protein
MEINVENTETTIPTTDYDTSKATRECKILQLVGNMMINCARCTVKLSRYRPGVAQRVGRGIALLFYDGGIRRE